MAYLLYTEMEETHFYFQTETVIVGEDIESKFVWNLKTGKKKLLDSNGVTFNKSELVDTTKGDRNKIKKELMEILNG